MTKRPEKREGVIRFRADHVAETLPKSFRSHLGSLLAWRRVLRAVGWLGQERDRYGGYGFGNLSLRVPGEGFVITGSQTSGMEEVGMGEMAQVRRWSVEDNRVESWGLHLPSSESLSHAALYALSPDIRAVFHVHAPQLFRWALETPSPRLPTTAVDVEAGTPRMAEEIARAWRAGPPRGFGEAGCGVLVMGGHPDGLLAFGESADAAGRSLVRVAVRAARHSSDPSESVDSPGVSDVTDAATRSCM